MKCTPSVVYVVDYLFTVGVDNGYNLDFDKLFNYDKRS